MSAPRRVPTIVFERRQDRTAWRWLTGSALAHAVIVFALVFDWSGPPALPEIRTPGGEGPVGGGGGGGGTYVTDVVLMAWDPPAREEPEEQPVEEPEDFEIPLPQVVEVHIEMPRFEIPRVTRTDLGAQILGRGHGIGGGPGAGSGSGGGIGSGQGTGVGSATGPGTGGDGGEIFPPTPRYVALPLDPNRPRSVKGRDFHARFLVSKDGRVERVDVIPEIRDGDYRRKVIAMLLTWSFAPAVMRDGTPVQSEVVVPFTL
jgi:protein TonB